MTLKPQTPPKAADRILGVATELFYREGSRGVGVDEIVVRAQATKPTLYRAFGSKDQLIAAYLEGQAQQVWAIYEAAMTRHPEDPRARILAYFDALETQSRRKSDRGSGLSNAAVEYPDPAHPGRQVVVSHKDQMRKRLRELTRAMDARKPKKLADGLLLLMEGAFITRQIFGEDGPAAAARGAAEALIDAHTRKDAAADPG
jgi:AcrR family transcriptional regulator